jgi:TolB-like protein
MNLKRIVTAMLIACAVCTGGFAQNAVPLDAALREAAQYFYEIIPAGSVIAILDFEAEKEQEAAHVVDEFAGIIVNGRVLKLVDRGRLAQLIEREKNLHMTGRVDDAAQVRIGHELGAHSIITGTLTSVDGGYRLRMQSVDVLSGQVSGVWGKTVNLADEGWKKKKFYLGAGAGFSFPSFSDAAGGFLPGYAVRDFRGLNSFEGEIRFSFAFIEYVGLATGIIFGADSFELYNPKTNHYLTTVTCYSAALPLMVKAMYHPGIFRLQAYGGAYLSFPLGQMEVSDGKNSVKADFTAPAGFIAGVGVGIKLGPSLLMIDGRYLSDFSNLSVKYNGLGENTATDLGKRRKFCVWLGLEFGF